MSQITEDTLEVLAKDAGISMSRQHLKMAAKALAAAAPRMSVLRGIELLYLEGIEPAHAWRWIAAGGRLPGPTDDRDT